MAETYTSRERGGISEIPESGGVLQPAQACGQKRGCLLRSCLRPQGIETILRIEGSGNDMNLRSFPRQTGVRVPPIKSQGIKTKLVPFIFRSISWTGQGVWIEPFFGTGVVGFNAAPKKALAADTNRHLIDFYKSIQAGKITPRATKLFLEAEGAKLAAKGEQHFYDVRKRFNEHGDPLDFLFLSRSCFNGMIRFNRKGHFNVPFCRKPERFRQAYITKIVNQVEWVSFVISSGDWHFEVSDWKPILEQAAKKDFVYLDPPYIGRHTDYYDSWDEQKADQLALKLRDLPCGFAYSMWARNRYRENEHLARWFSDYPIRVERHFYHVGPTEDLRNAIEEALVLSPLSVAHDTPEEKRARGEPLTLDIRDSA